MYQQFHPYIQLRRKYYAATDAGNIHNMKLVFHYCLCMFSFVPPFNCEESTVTIEVNVENCETCSVLADSVVWTVLSAYLIVVKVNCHNSW